MPQLSASPETEDVQKSAEVSQQAGDGTAATAEANGMNEPGMTSRPGSQAGPLSNTAMAMDIGQNGASLQLLHRLQLDINHQMSCGTLSSNLLRIRTATLQLRFRDPSKWPMRNMHKGRRNLESPLAFVLRPSYLPESIYHIHWSS